MRAAALTVLLLIASTAPAAAQAAAAIVVDSLAAAPSFPAGVTFTLRAHGSAAITHAVVSYRFTGDAVTRDVVAPLTAGATVAVQAPLDARRHYMPPGVDISYYWSLDDAAGHHLDTPLQQIRYDDTRYAWQTGADPVHHLRVHWYEGDATFGQELRDAGSRGLARLQQNFGLTLTRPIEIWVYPSQASFVSALPPNLPEWVGGKAFVESAVVMALINPVSGGSSEVRRIVPHELSHLAVYQATQNPYNGPPAWLDEGLAINNQEVQDPAMAQHLKQAAAADHLIRLPTLQGSFPADPEAADLSYAESASATRFLLDHYGGARVGAVLAAFRAGVTYDDALRAGIGEDTAALDAAWETSLTGHAASVVPPGGVKAGAARGPGAAVGGALSGDMILLLLAGAAVLLATAAGLLLRAATLRGRPGQPPRRA